MKKIEKQAILQYFKNCIVDDSKEELSIELDRQKSNYGKLFLPDSKNKDFYIDDFRYTNEELSLFFEKLKGEGVGKEKSETILENIDILETEKQKYFLEKAFFEYFNNKNWDKKNGNKKNINTLIDFINWGNNTLRQKIVSQINNFLFYIKSDKEYLKGEDLKKLFFSGDNDDSLEKIEFFGNENFLDFYDKNKTEKIYICLENVITERNKKVIFQPLYFIEVEIEEDSKEHFFTISISESNVSFNFFIEYYGKKLFNIQNKQEKDEGFQLEKDIDGLSLFKSKIDLYKANIIKDFDKKNIKNNPCLISANDIGFIKGLLKEYQELIDEKDLSDISNTGLGIIFNESKFEKNNISNLTRFTLLNNEQEKAVKQSLENKLSVIVGPPGTGKSQVVVNIMLNAYINNKTVLFASKNNTAVDTVLKKVSDLKLSYYPFLRLGSKKAQDKWYPKIKNNLLQDTKTNYIDFQDITKLQKLIYNLEEKIKNIEDNYLKYFESYEKLELILNDYEEGFREYVYKEKILELNFNKINKFINKLNQVNEKIKFNQNYLSIEINKIEKYIQKNTKLEETSKNIENGNIQEINIALIKKDINKQIEKIEKTEKKVNIKLKELNIQDKLIKKESNKIDIIINENKLLNNLILKYIENGEIYKDKIDNYKNIVSEIEDFINIRTKEIKILDKELEKYKLNISEYNKIIEDKKSNQNKIISKNNLFETQQKIVNGLINNNHIEEFKININSYIDKYKKLDIKLNNKISEQKKLLLKYSYSDFIIDGVSSELKEISLKNNYISYKNITIHELKNLLEELIYIDSYGFIKTFLGFKSRDIKSIRNIYYKLIEKQPNSLIQKYFFDITDELNTNIIKIKIKEIILLNGFEEKYIKYNTTNNDYQIEIKKINSDLLNLEIDFNKFINKNISNFSIENKTYSLNDYDNSYIEKKIISIENIFNINNELNDINYNCNKLIIKQEELNNKKTNLENELNKKNKEAKIFIQEFSDDFNINFLIFNKKNLILSLNDIQELILIFNGKQKLIDIQKGIIYEKEQLDKEYNIYSDKYQIYLKDLSKKFLIDFLNYNKNQIFIICNNIKELINLIQFKNGIKKELNNIFKSKKEFINSTNLYLESTVVKNILDEIDNDNFIEKLNNLLKLEEINIQKNEITKKFTKLTDLEKNITELNKEIFKIQGRLKDKSLDYLSHEIAENINDIKPKLTDSIDKIYNVFSFIKNWGDSKDSYLIKKYKKVFEGIKIFITTNLSTSSLPLEKGFYDYLIIDEASQNDIASVIPLLYRVKNVIIIGDPNQLQNITKLKEDDIVKIFYHTLKKKNLKDKDYAEDFKDIYNFNNSVYSSFESIYKSKLNKSLVTLNEHYRCHDDIINYSNFIVGEYKLFPKVYGKNKNIKNTQIPIGIHWVADIKNDNSEITKRNEKEAEAIIEYLKEILGILGDKVSIGVIAPFRNQVNYINKLIRNNKMEGYENILVDTVHKFQGDEKDIILFSTVFPNAKASIFLNDVNLLNVAVSRARNSFLIFGDKQAIKNYKGDNGEELLYTTLLRYTQSVKKGKEIVKYKKYDTEFEKQFFKELEKAGIKFDYQYPIYEGRYNLDFRLKLKGANNYLNLELDGGVHNKIKSYDYTRNKKVEKLGYKVIRYSNSYMQQNMGEIIEGLKKVCELSI